MPIDQRRFERAADQLPIGRDPASVRRRIEAMEGLLERAFHMPGTKYRIGLDSVVGLVPVVGVPLPLISYGGTSLLTLMLSAGLLMNVHVHRIGLDEAADQLVVLPDGDRPSIGLDAEDHARGAP